MLKKPNETMRELNKIDERAEQSEFQSKCTNGIDPLKGLQSKNQTPIVEK